MIGFLFRLIWPSGRRRSRRTHRAAERSGDNFRPLFPTSRDAPKHIIASGTLKGLCHVSDGDTIVIKNTHIRLAGIDAPELDQPLGNRRNTR